MNRVRRWFFSVAGGVGHASRWVGETAVMDSGSRYHLLRTLLTGAIVGGSLCLANLYGFKGKELPDGSQFLNHGWPAIYLMRSAWFFDWTQPAIVESSRWPFWSSHEEHLITWCVPGGLFANLLTSAVILACTSLVAANPKRFCGFPRQMTLRSLLIAVVLASVIFGLSRAGPVYWQPLVTWKPLIFFPVLYGIMCVVVVLDFVLKWLLHAAHRRMVSGVPEGDAASRRT